jgi:O-glycosyl hydrolase
MIVIGVVESGLGVVSAETISIIVDGSKRFQRIDGFGVNANPASWNNGKLRPALDTLVDKLGATIWRIIIENADWEMKNDNEDPKVFNWAYYKRVYETPKFQDLWNTIAYLKKKGVQVLLNVMGVVPSWIGGSVIKGVAEDEWVEMIASLVYYSYHIRKVRIDMLSPMNETDLGPPEGPTVGPIQYVRLLRKLVVRLEELGLGDMRIVAPDTAYIDQATSKYIPALLADSIVMSKLDRFAVHNYDGHTGNVDAMIKNSPYSDRSVWLTEYAARCPACDNGQTIDDEWGFARNSVRNLLNHLRDGAAAGLVYDAYDSFYEHHASMGYWGLLAYNSASKSYTPRKRFYATAQIFKFVARGARRLGTSISNGQLQVSAFYHDSSPRLTIVGYNSAATGQVITGKISNLPADQRLAFYQTSARVSLRPTAVLVVTAGKFSAQVPPDCVFTLTSVN